MIQDTGKTGVLFTLIGTQPYTRKDGTQTLLRVWQGCCAKPGCGKTFTIRTSSEGPIARNNNSGRKHCDQHKADFKDFFKLARDKRRARVDQYIPEIRQLHRQGFSAPVIALIVPLCPNSIRAVINGKRK